MTLKEKIAYMLPLMQRDRFTVLDIETTGLSPDKGGRIIEIGAVRIEDGKITDTFKTLINPEQKIYGKTTELTGITNEMLEGKPVVGKVLPELYKFIGDSVVVAHNSDFDWDRFLIHYFRMVGIVPNNKVIDTLALDKHFFKNRKKHGLEELCSELGVPLENHHRAIDDAEATAKCFLKMIEMFGDKSLLFGSLLDVSEGEQIGLIQDKKESSSIPVTNEAKLKIKKINYWEKAVSKTKVMKRLYVNINDGYLYGNVYFDIPTKTWYNKDYPSNLDFEAVHDLALRFLNLENTEDLCSFRN